MAWKKGVSQERDMSALPTQEESMMQDQERTRILCWYGQKRKGEEMHGEGKAEEA